jgi:hypothetical protein
MLAEKPWLMRLVRVRCERINGDTAFCAPQYCTLPSNMPEFLDDLHRTIVTLTFLAAFTLNLLRRIFSPPPPPHLPPLCPPSETIAPLVCNSAHLCLLQFLCCAPHGSVCINLRRFRRTTTIVFRAKCKWLRMPQAVFDICCGKISPHLLRAPLLPKLRQHLNHACVRTCPRDSLCSSSPHGCSSLLLLRFSCKLRCRSATSLP